MSDYDSGRKDTTNIYTEWTVLSQKIEILLKKHMLKDKTFKSVFDEIEVFEKSNEGEYTGKYQGNTCFDIHAVIYQFEACET